MLEFTACPCCGRATEVAVLAEAHWYPYWEREDGACPGCVQQHLLTTLLEKGEGALHREIQARWPIDTRAAFGALPTPLRLHADPRFTGRGVTIAVLDSDFHPHPDLVRPRNRIRAYVDATRHPPRVRTFSPDETPWWPDCNSGHPRLWHGLMTSGVCAGNGFLSHGLYRGLASQADLVLVRVRPEQGPISNEILARALDWVRAHARDLSVRVVTLSVAGEAVTPLSGNPADGAAMALVASGISVVAAAGNDGKRSLTPPATAPMVLTIGGLDDKNTFAHEEVEIWHSNYGEASNAVPKPEIVAPSIWVAAPLLPGSDVAREAPGLFDRRAQGHAGAAERIAALKLITPHYQHVEGTSFAAPVVAAGIACLLEANPALTPLLVRDVLMCTAQSVPGAPTERQGAGAFDAGRAVARALHERHGDGLPWPFSPRLVPAGVVFGLHDHAARQVEVLGSWNGWRSPGCPASRREAGVWETPPQRLDPGEYAYKFLVDGERWLDDPGNALKAHDGAGNLNSVLVVP